MSFAEDAGYDAYDYDDFYCDIDVWLTKDGTQIKISDMTDRHLYFAYKKTKDERLEEEMLLRMFAKSMEIFK